jgi:hypothetical protein
MMEQRSKREKFNEEVLAEISALPADEQHDAMLVFFGTGLRKLTRHAIRRMRADLIHEFPSCLCGCDLRPALHDLLEGHLVLRDLGLLRQDRRP